MIDILIILHATLGGIALLSGLIPLMSQKGSKAHKQYGKVFYFSMLAAALVGVIITVLPEHESPFLFTIGIFSCYLVLSGRRALRFKKEKPSLIDQIISIGMLITGIGMITFPLIVWGGINIVLTVFGLLGISLAITDLRVFKNPEKLKKGWLKMHIGKITGGYIAATTAFVIVNNTFLPPLVAWLAPGVLGSIYIVYWTRKMNA